MPDDLRVKLKTGVPNGLNSCTTTTCRPYHATACIDFHRRCRVNSFFVRPVCGHTKRIFLFVSHNQYSNVLFSSQQSKSTYYPPTLIVPHSFIKSVGIFVFSIPVRHGYYDVDVQ